MSVIFRKGRRSPPAFFLFCGLLILHGCAFLDSEGGRAAVTKSAKLNGWIQQTVQTDRFNLFAVGKPTVSNRGPLTIYIEGDGRAWLDKHTVSPDPTPTRPIALRLALLDPADNVIYLGRPCQYVQTPKDSRCHPRIWTSHRYSSAVVDAYNSAIDQLKLRTESHQVELIGYSGGGAIAVLLASQRKDVGSIITIAANLDTEAWTSYLGVTPLSGSLNPVTQLKYVSDKKQIHLAGQDDKIVPPAIIRSALRQARADLSGTMLVVEDYDHECCWHKNWGQFLRDFRRHKIP